MPKFRAYIYVKPNSNAFGPYASVCGSLKGGCFNTGAFDSDAPRGQGCLNADPQQFASFQDLVSYAAARGETLMEVETVAAINKLCSSGIAPALNQLPSSIPGANFQPFVNSNASFYPPQSCGVGGGQKVGGAGESPIVAPEIQVQSEGVERVQRVIDLSRAFPMNTIVY